MLQQFLARFYPYEIHLLAAWSVLAIAQKYMGWNLGIVVAVLAFDLCLFYILFDKVIIKKPEDSLLTRLFPKIYGLSLTLVVIGVSLKSLGFLEENVTMLGMFGTLISCALVFHTPIQDKFLPILKVFLLRTLIVLILGFVFSF